MSGAWRRTGYAVPAETSGDRLDAWLAGQPGAPTRSQIKAAADDDRLRIGDKPVRASYRLRGGERIELLEPEVDPSAAPVVGEAIDLDVLFEDDHILAVNKPAGMVVHPAAGNRSGTLVHALLYRDPSIAWPGQAERAGIVHRLDRDTSGVILVAKNVRAHEALSKQFRERTIRKTYLALVHGVVREGGHIDLPIGRHPTERKRMSVTGKPARAAVTDYRPIERFGACTLLEVKPLTGRTHQIRVHLAASGLPIVGDKVYGRRTRGGFSRQALHAAAIEFDYPVGGPVADPAAGVVAGASAGGRLVVEAPLADDIAALLAGLRPAAELTRQDDKAG